MPDTSLVVEVVDGADTVLSLGRLEAGSLSYDPKQGRSLGGIQQREISLAAAEEIEVLVSLRVRLKNIVVFAFEFV